MSQPFHLAHLLDARCALFLDFDGTLVDLAPQPEAVHVPPALPSTLKALSERLGGALAVVSGRSITMIDTFLEPLHLPAAGVHGSERRRADGSLDLLEPPSLALVEHAAAALATQYPDLKLEPKRGAVALHYRQAPELEAVCRQAMEEAVAASPGVSLLRGKMVFEAKSAEANKGLAIESFMGEAPFAGRRPVFIGDDLTDEPGFSVVQHLGGIGVKVGGGPTLAAYRLDSAQALRDAFAEWLAEGPVLQEPAAAGAPVSP